LIPTSDSDTRGFFARRARVDFTIAISPGRYGGVLFPHLNLIGGCINVKEWTISFQDLRNLLRNLPRDHTSYLTMTQE
jgi:hypothetical protein